MFAVVLSIWTAIFTLWIIVNLTERIDFLSAELTSVRKILMIQDKQINQLHELGKLYDEKMDLVDGKMSAHLEYLEKIQKLFDLRRRVESGKYD